MDFLKKYTNIQYSAADVLAKLENESTIIKSCDVFGKYFENVAVCKDKQDRVFEIFLNENKVNETVFIFRMITEEITDYSKTDKSRCLVKILLKSLDSLNFWNKLIKMIGNDSSDQKSLSDLLNIRIFFESILKAIGQYYKSLNCIDGCNFSINEELVEEKSKVALFKNIEFSQMAMLLYFLLSHENVGRAVSRQFFDSDSDFSPEFQSYLNKSFRILCI